MTSPSTEWTRQQIRDARRTDLVALLQSAGFELRERGAGNYEPLAIPGLFIKASYWRWPERNMQGNTIDFLIQVRGHSFNKAMAIIARS